MLYARLRLSGRKENMSPNSVQGKKTPYYDFVPPLFSSLFSVSVSRAGGGGGILCVYLSWYLFISPEKWKVDKENGASL